MAASRCARARLFLFGGLVFLTSFWMAVVVQMDPETEDRVSRASQRLSRGSHYRDSMRMSSRQSFVQLVSDLRGNKKPEGEAMRYATRRRSRSTADSAPIAIIIEPDIN